MTTPRRDLAAATYAADKAIDKVSRDLATRLRAAVERRAVETPDGKRITAAQRGPLLRDIDAILDRAYPKRRGAPSVMQALIEGAMVDAAAKPFSAAVAEIRRRVDDELYAAMGGE